MIETEKADPFAVKEEAEFVDLELLDKLDRANRKLQEIERLEQKIAERKATWDASKEAAKEARGDFDAAVSELRAAIRRHDDPQKELPFDDSEQEYENDDTFLHDVRAVIDGDERGFTKSVIKALESKDVKTVSQLEELIRVDEWWHSNLDGVGPKKVDDLTEVLLHYRIQNPLTPVDSDEDDQDDAGVIDDDGEDEGE